VVSAYPWLTRDYDYAHAAVRLRFFRVVRWSGQLHGRENQRFEWQRPGAVEVAPLLPANGPILKALALPPVYGISNAAEAGIPDFMQALERALAGGLALLQVREPALRGDSLARFAAAVMAAARPRGARVLLNCEPDLAQRVGADGVHLSASRLMALGAPSHPGVPTLGWEEFARLIRDYPLPVYALGGLKRADLEAAWRSGAHGIAMMRGAWA
jgi:8-oxo-dGTP diphosphatase